MGKRRNGAPRRGRRANGRRRRGGARGQALIPHPPPLTNIAIVHERRLRFTCNSAFAGAITFQNLLDLLGFAATATVGYDLFYAVRMRAVECWALPILGQATTVEVVYDGNTAGSVGDQRIHTDSSMGIEPAHIVARPAGRSGAALFQESSANQAFYLNVPSGAVVDVMLSFTAPMQGQSVPMQNALVAATAGALFFRGLDGLGAATSKLLPVVGYIL